MSGEPARPGSGDLRAALPEELSEFFSMGGRSLLIKGGTGTGKTTLALTLLRALSGNGSALYLSTREAPAFLRRDHPWLETLEAKRSPAKRGRASEVELVDARLDEATQLFERITSKLMDSSAPLVLIDTLDALQDFIDAKALKTNVRVLQTWCERAGARLIVTLEDPDSRIIDPLMDGVVVLKQRLDGERRLRQVELLKLYGVNISRPSHAFTLSRGWFRSFSEPRESDFTISPSAAVLGGVRPRAGPRGAFFSTGYGELDAALAGGIPAGRVTSVDVESGVDPRVAFLLLGRSIAGLAEVGRVILGPLAGVAPGFVDGYLRLLPDSVRSRIERSRAGEVPTTDGPDRSPIMSVIDAESEGRSIGRYAELAAASGGATVVVRRGERRRRQRGTSADGARLRICRLGGAVLVASESPYSQFLGVSVVNETGAPQLELEPVL